MDRLTARPPPRVYEIEAVLPRCPRCGYDLRATVTMAGSTCSECGAALSFDRLRFRGRPSWRGVLRTTRRVGPAVAVATAIALAITGIVLGDPFLRWSTAAGGTFLALLVVLRVGWPHRPFGLLLLVSAAITIVAFVASATEIAVLAGVLIVLIGVSLWLSHRHAAVPAALEAVGPPALNIRTAVHRICGRCGRGRRSRTRLRRDESPS